MRFRLFWFSRSTKQALIETLLIGGGIWLSILLIQIALHSTTISMLEWIESFYINLICLSWFLLRLNLPTHFLSKALLKQIVFSFIVSVILNIFYFYTVYLIFLFHHIPNPTSNASILTLLWASVLSLIWLLAFIGITHLLRFWNHLRQQSLRWALIHAHIMVLVIVLAISGLISVKNNIMDAIEPFPKLDFMLLSNFFFALELFTIVLLFLLIITIPPLILFSYLVTFPTIKRLQALVASTDEMRRGHYDTRAHVKGQDEVAQLQKNFNSMADELEHVIHDLETERDHVAVLLGERRTFFANVSHELRTPIATLRGYLESTLQDQHQVPPPTLWKDLTIMEREVLQLQERADELFDLSKAEVGQIMIRNTACDIRQIVKTLVDSYAPLAWRTYKIEIVADLPDTVPMVRADAQYVEQALKNIVRNALRHTPPGGVIALMINIEAERVGISIEDTGEGIAPEALEHIWERFYQAQTTHRQEGAGIGLSLVKNWLTAMGGSVAATSTLGEGSCFTIYLLRLLQIPTYR